LVISTKKGKLKMTIEEMAELIMREWSDSMSDSGAIWARTNDELKKAKADYSELYEPALALAYEIRKG